jgi:hypothetical protein
MNEFLSTRDAHEGLSKSEHRAEASVTYVETGSIPPSRSGRQKKSRVGFGTIEVTK